MSEAPSIRVIRINASKREVTEEHILDGEDNLKCLQSLVGGYIEPAGVFIPTEPGPNGVRHYVMVDEEGLLKGKAHGFTIALGPHTQADLVGNGVITGINHHGVNVSAIVDIEDVKAHVHFFDVTGG